MAERRRIIPLSVGPFIKQEEAKPKKPTPRFSLSLAESNERECSEFSFSELMKNALGDEVEQPDPKFNQLEEDDLTGMAALAKKFEQKYGPQKAKKKRQQIEDIIDVGLGYDETDPFVDNSECYDELIPSMLDTKLGGFYINSGQLDFKEIDVSSDGSEIHVHKKRKNNKSGKKKRSKSSESRNGSKKERKKRKSSSMADTSKKKAKRHLSGHLGREKKKKKDKSNPTIAELLQRKAEVDTGVSNKATAKTPVAPTLNNGNITTLEEEAADLMGSFNLPLDSEMEQAMRDVMVDVENTMGMVSDAEMSASANEGDSSTTGYTKCPEGLKEPLKLNIMKIKEAATKSEEGKCKFFTNEVNNLLLEIEKQVRSLSCGTRSSVYSHLSHHLPCGKETLLKRAKKLRLSEQDSKLKAPLQKLREAVGQAMPALLERYQEECQAATQAKYDKIINGKEKPEEAKSEEDDGGDGGDKNKSGTKSSLPKKKFIWTDTLRDLLGKVVLVKVRAYEMLKSRSQSAEDYLKAFLEAEIKGFWPQGWMQTRMLFKESRRVHQHLTSTNPVKPKKPFVLLQKVQLEKKSPSPVPPETPSSALNPAPSGAVAGLSYASSILKEMAFTKKADSAQKDVPTILDYANKNNAATNYSVIYSSTAKAAGNTSAANPPLRLSGNVGKTSPVTGTQSSNQHHVEHLQAKDTDSHQPSLNAIKLNVIKTANNRNFNDSFVNSLIARNLKMAAGDSVVSQEGFSDLKPPDMSSAFELLAEAAMEHSDAPGKSTSLKSLADSRQHSLGISGLNLLKTLNKDKNLNTQPVVRMNLIDKKALKSLNVDLANQTKHTSLHSSQGTQQKSYTNSSSTASTPVIMQKGTNNVTPKWSGNSYLKMVDKTKQLPTHATQFMTNAPHKNMFHTIQEGHTVSKEKDSLVSGKLPSKDVSASSGVLSNTNKQFLTPQHVSPKRTVQTGGYMQQQRGSNAAVIPQRLSSSAPKQPMSQHVKQTNRTSPSPFNNQSPTGPSSMTASSHSPMSPRTSPSSPSAMSARSLFHPPTSPQQQQPTTVGAGPPMNLLGLNYANNYTMQQLAGFQMQFADMAMKHSGSFPMSVGQGSPGHSLQQQSPANQTSPEAVITGPAPGTFYYTQGGSSGVFNTMHGNTQQHLPHEIPQFHQTFTDPRFTQDSSGQMQHRIP